MLDQHRLASSGTDHNQTLLARRIEATDRQIDGLVYKLYYLVEKPHPKPLIPSGHKKATSVDVENGRAI